MAAHDGSPSSSSSSFGSSTYDVFLSFRGEDTRNNFTGFLHNALEREGINVFIDSEGLWAGEEIQPALFKAIQGSKISIPVFSKGYADSKWCLQELVEIVRCYRANSQIILPIFLDVEPRDVRHQTGSFRESFQRHKEIRFDAEIEEWKEALIVVGGISGYHLNQVNGNQSKLVRLVVDRALQALSKMDSYCLGDVKNLIGLDARVEDLLSLLNVGSNDVRFVGICGIGGIGKTTIAKALYNRILNSFHSCCFLANVKEIASGPNGLVSLQEQLICTVSKKRVDRKIWNVDIGQQLIKELQGENILLILDDVEDRSQLKAFAIEFNWFGLGSRILITSRDEHILKVANVKEENIYRPNELDDEQSLQLFSLHAFSMDQPLDDYKQLSHDVIHLAGGLPLTLEVLGSTFCDIRKKEEWQSMLQDLKRIPHKEVQKKLKISFDNLEDHEKSIFLDAACFFIGWRKEIVISIWDACGFNPISAIKKLTQRSLLKFTSEREYSHAFILDMDDYYEKLSMHDQIQSMGRGIVLEESPMEPGNRSRLWCHDEIMEVIEEQKGTQMIEGIFQPFYYKSFPIVHLHKEDFTMMSKLRFLHIHGKHFEGDFPHLPSSLRWFSWEECAWEILPTNFYHKKLIYMDLSRSPIRQAWTNKPRSANQLFQKLKVLRLQQCDHLCESPDFSWFPYLETLDLGECINMVDLYKSICDLKSLVELFLSGTKIEELPENICRLSSLKHLDLNLCMSLKNLPKSIGDLKSLTELLLYGTKVKGLPNNICRLSSLQNLHLSLCTSLKNLPESIGDLKSLVELMLSGTEIEELPNSFCRLSSLQNLHLSRCTSLKNLSESFGDLKSLVELLLSETEIEELPYSFCRLSSLQTLHLRSCRSLKNLPESIGDLKSLVHLQLEDTKVEEFPNSVCRLSSLKKLNLRNCKLLNKLPESIGDLNSLAELYLDGMKIKELPHGMGRLEKLMELSLKYCHNPVNLPIAGGRMRCLRSINLLGTSILLPPDDFLMLPSLVELVIGNKLESSLPPWVSGLLHLQTLTLRGYTKLESVQELPSTLTYLNIEDCISLQKLPALSSLKKLRELRLCGCKKLKEIRGIERTESLELLYMSNCNTITDTPRKILGQGTLSVDESQGSDSLNVNNDGMHKGLILCLVFAFHFKREELKRIGLKGELRVGLEASIRRKDTRTKTRCLIDLKMKGLEFTNERDVIYIHHFKEYEWFGFPLEGTDAIEETRVEVLNSWIVFNCKLKFWKVLWESMESEQEMPNPESSANIVADFFTWSFNDAGTFGFAPQQVEEERMSNEMELQNSGLPGHECQGEEGQGGRVADLDQNVHTQAFMGSPDEGKGLFAAKGTTRDAGRH